MAASIFVNPAQFGPGEDFARYPRAFEQDLERLAGAGADAVYAPPPEEIYPAGFDTWIEPGSGGRGHGRRRPSRPFSRRGHGGRQAVRGGASRLRLFRAERRAAAGGDPQAERRPGPGREHHRHAHHPGGGRAGVEQPQRLSDAGATGGGGGHLPALGAGRSLWWQGARDAGEVRAAAAATLGAEPMLEAVDYISIVDAETMAPAARLPAPTGQPALTLLTLLPPLTLASGDGPVMLAVAARLGGRASD